MTAGSATWLHTDQTDRALLLSNQPAADWMTQLNLKLFAALYYWPLE